MPWPWVILARVPRVVAGEAPADGEGEAEVKTDAQAEGVREVELDAEMGVEPGARAKEVDEAEEVDEDAELASEEEDEEDDAELASEEEDEDDAELASEEDDDEDAELASEDESDDEEDVEHRPDFSIPVALPPRITVMTAAATAHPVRNYPDMYPYVLGVGSGCILLNFGVEPFIGVCFDDRPYQSNLVMVRHFDCSGIEQGHPTTATAEHIPARHGKYAVVSNIESIGFVSIGHGKGYTIQELMVNKGRMRAMLIYFNSGSINWRQETTQNPLPNDTNRGGEWVPSGVISYRKSLWWFDLSWGIISLDPLHDLEEPPLRFHRLPEGRALAKAPKNIHDRRCIAESQGGLRYVEIIVPEAEGEAATVSMWSWIPAADKGSDETIAWDMKYTMSFAEIWDHHSYKATRLPRKVPVLVLVCPTDANLVYFALELEERLFSVNLPECRVVEFVDDSYELVTPWPAAPSCRYVLPWFLPLKVAQGVGMDPFAGSDAEQLQEEYERLRESLLLETDGVEEDDVEVDWDLLGPVIPEDLPEIADSELPVDESSEEEMPLSVAMDPETLARLKAEMKQFAEDHAGPQSQGPGPGNDAGEGAFPGDDAGEGAF